MWERVSISVHPWLLLCGNAFPSQYTPGCFWSPQQKPCLWPRYPPGFIESTLNHVANTSVRRNNLFFVSKQSSSPVSVACQQERVVFGAHVNEFTAISIQANRKSSQSATPVGRWRSRGNDITNKQPIRFKFFFREDFPHCVVNGSGGNCFYTRFNM